MDSPVRGSPLRGSNRFEQHATDVLSTSALSLSARPLARLAAQRGMAQGFVDADGRVGGGIGATGNARLRSGPGRFYSPPAMPLPGPCRRLVADRRPGFRGTRWLTAGDSRARLKSRAVLDHRAGGQTRPGVGHAGCSGRPSLAAAATSISWLLSWAYTVLERAKGIRLPPIIATRRVGAGVKL